MSGDNDATRKNKRRHGFSRCATVVAVIGLSVGLLGLKPEVTTAAWTDSETAVGTISAGTMSFTLGCENINGGGPFGTDRVRISWVPSRGVPAGTTYELVVTNPATGESNAQDPIEVGTPLSFVLESYLDLGLFDDTERLYVSLRGTYVTPETEWVTENPPVLEIDYDPGLLVGDLHCP